VYVLLCSIARNIVFVVIVISHAYSLPLSKLFCLKGSLNLKERRGNFLKVLLEVVRSKWFKTKQHVCDIETNAPVITHQKLNYMSVICKVMPLSTPTINQPQQF